MGSGSNNQKNQKGGVANKEQKKVVDRSFSAYSLVGALYGFPMFFSRSEQQGGVPIGDTTELQAYPSKSD